MSGRRRGTARRLLALLLLVHAGADVAEAIPCALDEPGCPGCPAPASSEAGVGSSSAGHLDEVPSTAIPPCCFCCTHSAIHSGFTRSPRPPMPADPCRCSSVEVRRAAARPIEHPPRAR
jgi:hypothetical protein